MAKNNINRSKTVRDRGRFTRLFQPLFFSIVFLFILSLSGASLAGQENKKNPEFVIKIATLAPDGSVWMEAMRVVNSYVEEASNGRYHAKYYGSGVLGDEPDVVRKMKLGQLGGSGVSLSGVRLTCPEFQVMELPFLFGNLAYDEAEYVYDILSREFDSYAEKRGYKVIAISTAGFAHICSKEPLQRILKDLPQQRFWQWEGENVMKEISDSLSIPTMSLPLPDTLTALQTGMINAFYGTSLHVLNFQWYKYIRYIYTPSLFYTPSFAVTTLKAWNEFPPDIQALFFDEKAEGLKKESLRWVHEADKKALETLKKSGIQVVEILPEELEEIRVRTRGVWESLAGDVFPKELLNKIVNLLDEYRSQKEEGTAVPSS